MFKSIPISSIIVNREERQRSAPDEIEELANSIHRLGLINPITITRENILIAGERRLLACKSIGWTSVDVKYLDELSPNELHLIELEENIKRKNLTWQDEAKAVSEYHAIRVSENTKWTMADTAKDIGVLVQYVSRRLDIVNEIKRGNTQVAEAPKISVADTMTKRNIQRRKNETLAHVDEAVAGPKNETPLLNVDFAQWAAIYKGPKFNFIHCDFPYGVNADKHNQNRVKPDGTYKDDFDTYTNLLEAFHRNINNFVDESAHLMFWFSMDYYDYTRTKLVEIGWRVNPFPLIWFKSNNSGIIPDAKRGPRRVYETAFMASRGDRFVREPVSNVCAYPNEKEFHMNEKPKGMLSHFFRMFVDDTSLVLDPTAGSANAIIVAKKLGAKHLLGLEINETYYKSAVENFNAK